MFGGTTGVVSQLERLVSCFENQRSFVFFAASVLVVYEGAARSVEEVCVQLRLVDFAHSFPSPQGQPDVNVSAALQGLLARLRAMLEASPAAAKAAAADGA